MSKKAFVGLAFRSVVLNLLALKGLRELLNNPNRPYKNVIYGILLL